MSALTSSSWLHAEPLRLVPRGGAHLLDAEPQLAEGLGPSERALARDYLVVPVHRMSPGDWSPPASLSRAIALLVTDGLLVCDDTAGKSVDVRLFGPGDLIDARRLRESKHPRWRVLTPVEINVLDARVLVAGRRWPQMTLALMHRVFDIEQDTHVLSTIRGRPRVEDRILQLVTHLASRWGQVTPDGVALTLPATHELLGDLVAARRPTVSLALRDLRERGLLVRLDDGRWLLPAVPAAQVRRVDARSAVAAEA